MQAPAKLNLGLRIVGRRADGYHTLQSLFWPLDLVDELWISEGKKGFRVEWTSDSTRQGIVPPGGDNLVERAARLAEVAGDREVCLRKRIPMGGGLGGGSSNAAAMLRYLSMRDSSLTDRLSALALQLGADVPFFLDPVPTWVEGVGERRRPLAFSPSEMDLHFLVVLLPKPLATPEVFSSFRDRQLPFSSPSPGPLTERLSSYLRGAANDLEPVASELYPLVGEVIAQLRRRGPLLAAMTGTGSTCYAVFASSHERDNTAKVLQPFFRDNHCKSLAAKTYVPT